METTVVTPAGEGVALDSTMAGNTGVTAPAGFSAAGIAAGLKKSGKKDLALVVNTGPEAIAAGVFTRNKVHSAAVTVSRAAVADRETGVRAVIINSGNANACTGAQGLADAQAMQAQTAHALHLPPAAVAVCSTGLIGEPLDMGTVVAGIESIVPQLDTTTKSGEDAATGILTTDTCMKQAMYHGAGWTIGAMAKGVGMMAPSLATMLAVITTDAQVDAALLHDALAGVSNTTFNTVDIDGTTSTNDSVIAMANGASGTQPAAEEFTAALHAVCADLAQQLQGDAEGVTKVVDISVTGATTDEQALEAARTVGRDNLFKCAMFGSDPNWGRVLAAVGMAPVDMDPGNIAVWFNGHQVCAHTTGVPGAREVDLSGPHIAVAIDLGAGGSGHATVHTTDLSFNYVEINSAYAT